LLTNGVQAFMGSSRITTLFSEPPPFEREPTSFAVSILFHCIAFIWLYFGLRHMPQLNDQSLARRYTVRLLREETLPEPRKKVAAGSGAARSSQRSSSQDVASGGEPTPLPSIAEELAQLRNHTQILIQPDVPPDVTLLKEVPVPTVVRWVSENTLEKTIVLPKPKVLSQADIRATVTPPNREQTVLDVKISSTPFKTQAPALPPSTTSPIAVHTREQMNEIPQSVSQSLAEATPARIVSLSDIMMKVGSAAVPLANSTPKTTGAATIAPGQAPNGSQNGNGNPGTVANGSGSGQNAASGNKTGAATGTAQNSAPGGGSGTAQNAASSAGSGTAIARNGGDGGTSPGSSAGTGLGAGYAITHINLPHDGQFGVVVVGSSLADQYPEIVDIWSGRLVYTVYLHVGLGKNWILQYSIPRTAEAAASGDVTRPEPPWPYDISRPDLAAGDYNSDAILVHGFVNLAGRFEKLAIAFPTEFAQAKFVLNALQQWKFRPARQNGQLAPVEVLLIIPAMAE
jgi:hypothetical protein